MKIAKKAFNIEDELYLEYSLQIPSKAPPASILRDGNYLRRSFPKIGLQKKDVIACLNERYLEDQDDIDAVCGQYRLPTSYNVTLFRICDLKKNLDLEFDVNKRALPPVLRKPGIGITSLLKLKNYFGKILFNIGVT